MTLKDNTVNKPNGSDHNHSPKLPENVQTMSCLLEHRVLMDFHQSVRNIYEEEVKNIC